MTVIECGGEINRDSAYTLDEFTKRTGLKRDALRSARHNGLTVTYKHNRAYILGRHWLAYLQADNDATASNHES